MRSNVDLRGAIYTGTDDPSIQMNDADRATAIHSAAAEGFSRGAQAYVRGRPDYPPQTRAWLRDDLGLRAGKVVLDSIAALEPPQLARVMAEVRRLIETTPELSGRDGVTFPYVTAAHHLMRLLGPSE
jgi:hypothetical protein